MKLAAWKYFSVIMALVLALGTGVVALGPTPAAAATTTLQSGQAPNNLTVRPSGNQGVSENRTPHFPFFNLSQGTMKDAGNGAGSNWYVDGKLGTDTDNITQGKGPGILAFKSIGFALAASGVNPRDTINIASMGTQATWPYYVSYAENLVITENITLQYYGTEAPWLTYSSHDYPVISIRENLKVNLTGLVLWGNDETMNDSEPYHGSGQGIHMANIDMEHPALCDVTVTDCAIWGFNVPSRGGGVYSGQGSTLVMTRCYVGDCTTQQKGGCISAAQSDVTMTDCYIERGEAYYNSESRSRFGGGVYLTGGKLNMERCTLSSNRSYSYFPLWPGEGAGGGLFIDNESYSSDLSLKNCTFTDNKAEYGNGGAIGIKGGSKTVNLTMTGCTFFNNEADYSGGGLYQAGTNVTTIINNCVFENDAQTAGDNLWWEAANTSITSDYSLYTTTETFNTPGTGNKMGGDPMLYYLADNGGLTPTCAIGKESQARGTGSVTSLSTDQRGIARPYDGNYDMGAYQYRGPDMYVDCNRPNDNGDGFSWATAKRHIYAAVNLADPSTTVTVAEGTYKEENHFDICEWGYNNINITKPLVLTKRAGVANPIIDDSEPKVSWDDTILDIFDGAGLHGGAVSVSGFTLTNADGVYCWGGGLYIESGGVTTVQDCVIEDNKAEFGGGGVYIENAGDVSLLGCTIRNNSTTNLNDEENYDGRGGGILIADNGNVTISNCTISGNTAANPEYPYAGGGIYSEDNDGVTISNCTISGNTAINGDGGGIFNDSDPLQLTNCTIYGNNIIWATGSPPGSPSYRGGGGIYNAGHAELLNCTVAENDAGTDGTGGGFFEVGAFTGVFKNTILANNTAGAGNPDDIAAGDFYEFVSNGHNICTTNGIICFDNATDKNSQPLLPGDLGDLADNGGPTYTCAISTTSPFFNYAVDGPPTDQRGIGYPRPALGGWDVGAFELQSEIPPTPTAPTITSINPNSGMWSETMVVTITGTNFTGATSVSFGTGITVTFTVASPTQINASITIAPGAVMGARSVTVTTPQGSGNGGSFMVKPNPALVSGSQSHGGGGGSGGSGGSTGQANQGMSPVSMPNIVVQSATVSATKVAPGETVTITANLANKGTVNATSAVKVYVNGQEETTQGVTVNSGSNRPVSFTLSRNEPGTYTVYVGGTQAGSFTVEQGVDPNMILFISAALVLSGIALGIIYIRRRQSYY